MNEDKICGLCGFVIDERKEYAALVTYFYKDKIRNIAFYHINCYREKLLQTKNLSLLGNKATQFMNKAMEKLN